MESIIISCLTFCERMLTHKLLFLTSLGHPVSHIPAPDIQACHICHNCHIWHNCHIFHFCHIRHVWHSCDTFSQFLHLSHLSHPTPRIPLSVRPSVRWSVRKKAPHHRYIHQGQGSCIIHSCIIHTYIRIKDHIYMHHGYMLICIRVKDKKS